MSVVSNLFFRDEKNLPVFYSSENSECGLVCLAMIASYHGHDVDVKSLRQRFSVSASGVNLRGLMRMAESIGFSTRAYRAEPEALDAVSTPAIIHWDMNHFVVLKNCGSKFYTIHDPVRGEIRLSPEEFSNHFTGILVELFPVDGFEKIIDRKKVGFTDLFSKITGHRIAIFYVVFLTIALQVISFIIPFQMQLVVDKAIANYDQNILLIICIAFGCLAILNVVISSLRNWSILLLTSQFVFQVAGNIFGHLIRVSASFFEKRHLGDVLSRLGSIRQIQDAVTEGALSAVIDGAMIILAGIALTIYSPLMAMIVFTTTFVCVLVTAISYPFIKNQSEKSISASAKEQSFLMESIRGVLPIKLMGGEVVRESSWRNLYSKSFNESLKLSRINIKVNFLEDVILAIQLVLIIYLGALSVLNADGLSLGMLISFLAFRSMFIDRIKNLMGRALQLGSLVVYIERLGDIIIEPSEFKKNQPISELVGGDIRLENVSFRYGAEDPLILKNVNLTIKEGEFISVVGPSGGGKTTLLKILLGLQKPTEGKVFLNGELATPELWQAWRYKMGVVRQDDQLFSGSLAENIAFFDPELNMLKVRDVARAAHIHEEIDQMPTKYLTPIGDMGSSLSGGQKQRILLARALYRSPTILMLDEGTANLDPETESVITDLIKDMNITRVVIAHRPALVNAAHRVIEIRSGDVSVVRL